MRWKKNIIRTMNRVAVVGSRVGGGVAHSRASRIPWQKRTVEGSAIQRGGGGGMLRYGLKKKMLKNQRGGSTFKYGMRMGDMFTGRRKKRQRGSGFGSWMERNMFGVKRTKRKTKRPQRVQKGGGNDGPFGLGKYYKSKSKKEQRQMDDWVVKNL